MGIACVDHLGQELESRWRALDYAPSGFCELAERALAEANLPTHLSPDELATWALEAGALPPQADPGARFGQPPLTLFRAPRFYVDALFWIDGTTSIHQHGFSGAFQLLAGSSIEMLFSFDVERTFDGHFALGTLQVSSSGVLRPGDVRPIWSGARLIHSVFHLDRPSVSIVVRTLSEPGAGPQFNYARAGIARNPFFSDETSDRKVQVASMLRAVHHPSFERLVGDLIARSDLHTAYRLIRECASHGIVDRLIERVSDQAVAERFRAAVKDHRRELFLVGRRGLVTDNELRFFLGALLNAPRRRDVLTLARQRRPDREPAAQVAAWLRHLSALKAKVQVEGAPWHPNLLGLPELDDELERACAVVFGGGSTSDLDARAAATVSKLRDLPALACLFHD
ncbi:MAG TPA: hypothetical protein VKZ18_16920 [Polyangia bacterium]|nr:hypothetical protein [Polyangia bacterium]